MYSFILALFAYHQYMYSSTSNINVFKSEAHICQNLHLGKHRFEQNTGSIPAHDHQRARESNTRTLRAFPVPAGCSLQNSEQKSPSCLTDRTPSARPTADRDRRCVSVKKRGLSGRPARSAAWSEAPPVSASPSAAHSKHHTAVSGALTQPAPHRCPLMSPLEYQAEREEHGALRWVTEPYED